MFRFIELISNIEVTQDNYITKIVGKHIQRHKQFLDKLEPVEIRYRGVNY